ncbi:unnamed protein product [Brachionus calyciflorus]|uniref:Uncharacterized protein n=1 Tax=Brachionus calyciflorus TaxID=104777 RepID=A0A814LA19_9BILA|nr:unnamed protein product [Brachionus calyciflorus]
MTVQETEINDENASLESLYTQFKEIKLSQFEKKWLEFKKINDESLENDFNKENIDCLISNTNLNCTENGSTTTTTRKLQLDGQDFLNSLLNKSECDETNINGFENKILKFIYENMDRNSTFRNTEIGPLFTEDGKQLNLINLVRLYNLVLILNGELISKVDRERLSLFANLLNSFTQSEESELIPIDDDSSQKSLLSNIFKGNKIINEESLRLKKKLDAFLPKLNENYCQLFEKDVVKAKIPASPFKDEVSNQVKEFLKEYFNLGKASLNPKLLKTLREKRQLELSSKQESKLDPIDESFKLSNESDENNLDDYEQSTKKNTAKKSINFSLDFVEKNNSFELLDLQDSNMDLI